MGLGLMGLMDLDRIALVQAVTTTAALITILGSQGTEITPTMGLILIRLPTGRNPISLTLHPSASVGRLLRRTTVTTHLHLHLHTVITHRRRRHHMAISRRRLPAPASALRRLPTADSGIAFSASFTHTDRRRRCPGNGQTGSTRLRTTTMGTDTDTREDRLV